jgi:hypothetical protein
MTLTAANKMSKRSQKLENETLVVEDGPMTRISSKFLVSALTSDPNQFNSQHNGIFGNCPGREKKHKFNEAEESN